MSIFNSFNKARSTNFKKFAVLIDPDDIKLNEIDALLDLAHNAKVDYFFVGGSLMVENKLDDCLKAIKSNSNIPCILFPGSPSQINNRADGILLLSLVSGRNAELLIGKHVEAAPALKRSNLEIISTSYLLIDGGAQTTASYISGTTPIPADKPEIAACTAMAAEMLGLSTIYLDAGSGAVNPISTQLIKQVKQATNSPIIVGGGVRNPQKAYDNCIAGADVQVIGNAIEKDPVLITEMAHAIHSASVVIPE